MVEKIKQKPMGFLAPSPAHKGGRAPVQLLRHHLQQPEGDVAVREAEPLQQEAPAGRGRGISQQISQGLRQPPGDVAVREDEPLQQEAPAAGHEPEKKE